MSETRTKESEQYIATLLRGLSRETDEPRTLQAVVDLAVATIPACEWAGVTIWQHKKYSTPASTAALVDRVDALQYDFDQGPCLDAVWHDSVYRIDDMTTEPRWPRWAPAAHGLGIGSVLSIRLSTPAELIGALNLYAGGAGAFDDDDVHVAHTFADHASAAVAVVHEFTGLRTALQSRHRIGMAQGILRARHGLDVDQTFTVLVRLSRDNNIRLVDLADMIVDANRLPPRFTTR